MRDKSEVSHLLRNFCIMIHTQFDKKVKTIHNDNGLEFTSNSMKQYYVDNGILHQTILVDTPRQNSRVERKHRHILNVARALLFQACLLIEF